MDESTADNGTHASAKGIFWLMERSLKLHRSKMCLTAAPIQRLRACKELRPNFRRDPRAQKCTRMDESGQSERLNTRAVQQEHRIPIRLNFPNQGVLESIDIAKKMQICAQSGIADDMPVLDPPLGSDFLKGKISSPTHPNIRTNYGHQTSTTSREVLHPV